jgi:hypothetical protein
MIRNGGGARIGSCLFIGKDVLVKEGGCEIGFRALQDSGTKLDFAITENVKVLE